MPTHLVSNLQERLLAEAENQVAQHNLACGNVESQIEQLDVVKAELGSNEQVGWASMARECSMLLTM